MPPTPPPRPSQPRTPNSGPHQQKNSIDNVHPAQSQQQGASSTSPGLNPNLAIPFSLPPPPTKGAGAIAIASNSNQHSLDERMHPSPPPGADPKEFFEKNLHRFVSGLRDCFDGEARQLKREITELKDNLKVAAFENDRKDQMILEMANENKSLCERNAELSRTLAQFFELIREENVLMEKQLETTKKLVKHRKKLNEIMGLDRPKVGQTEGTGQSDREREEEESAKRRKVSGAD